jgi:hypothetical protein
MDTLIHDFFKSWENEISCYQEVLLCLSDQKQSLIEWNIKRFQKISQQTAISISRAHRATNMRNDIMETLFVIHNQELSQNNLKTVSNIFEDESVYKEKAEILFSAFVTTLKKIDKLSADNKELIKTGLELVGDNLEMIADLIDKDRVYSRVGMIPQQRSSILLNTTV